MTEPGTEASLNQASTENEMESDP